MKKLLVFLLIAVFLLSLLTGLAAGKKEPQLILLPMQVGEISQAIQGEGTWRSDHPDIATVSDSGVITALAEGYTLVLLSNRKNEVTIRCEVQVGETPIPEEITRVIESALADWAEADGKPLPRYNEYTKWFNPAAKDGFGWCGAFVGLHFDTVGIEMNKEYRAKKAPPLPEGSLFAVRQASQTKLYEGFQSRNRLSNLPRPGYYIIYGKKGSTPYTHVGLVTTVQDMGEGVYLLETVEGNLGSRIKRFSYLYDSLAERKDRNIKPIPAELQTRPDEFNYEYVKDFYINVFGQTWY
ncbi:MAG: Ig-like domain-containing protein [Christensenellales bacterium]